MAAIYEPRRRPAAPQRPHLRLVPAGPGASIPVPVHGPVGMAADLGLGVRHLVAAVAALVLVLVASLAIGNGALASLSPAPAPASSGTSGAGVAVEPGDAVVVEAGDTVWSIARRVQPSGDVRQLVDQLVALNGSAPLQPGTTVQLPA
jgi:hypothetical protein